MFRHNLRLCRRDPSRRSDQAGPVTLHHLSDVQTPLNKPQPSGTSGREEKARAAYGISPADTLVSPSLLLFAGCNNECFGNSLAQNLIKLFRILQEALEMEAVLQQPRVALAAELCVWA